MSESIRIVHPVTGAPLLAGATLDNCFLLIAQQIFTETIPRAGRQHTDFMRQPFVFDCQSYAIGISMITNATKGQTHEIEVVGNVRQGGIAKVV